MSLSLAIASSPTPRQLIAFIDDDESAGPAWLVRLYSALLEYHVDGGHGPVKPRFAPHAKGVVKGEIVERLIAVPRVHDSFGEMAGARSNRS